MQVRAIEKLWLRDKLATPEALAAQVTNAAAAVYEPKPYAHYTMAWYQQQPAVSVTYFSYGCYSMPIFLYFLI